MQRLVARGPRAEHLSVARLVRLLLLPQVGNQPPGAEFGDPSGLPLPVLEEGAVAFGALLLALPSPPPLRGLLQQVPLLEGFDDPVLPQEGRQLLLQPPPLHGGGCLKAAAAHPFVLRGGVSALPSQPLQVWRVSSWRWS